MKLLTTSKSEVEVPGWASKYNVGDKIAYVLPHTGSTKISRVAGFSTKDGNEGLPVVKGHGIPHIEQLAITEEYHDPQ